MIAQFIDLVLHLDVHLTALAQQMGPWLYLILFLIIFAETGLIFAPFLPGDSLLFATGTVVALEGSGLDLPLMWVVLVSAAFIGDNVNYSVGHWIGPRIFSQPKSPFLNPLHLRRTHDFYQKHGGRTVFLARFLPILRTFAPFIAGVGRMKRRTFMLYSFSGSVVWMSLFLGCGYAFGNLPWVKRNLSLLIVAVLVISVAPILIGVVRGRMAGRASRPR